MLSTLARGCQSFWNSCKYLGASITIIMVKRKLRLRPHDWTIWLTLARLYELGSQWEPALDALERARKLNPHSQVITEVLARVQKAANQDSSNSFQSEN
jgi:cytochrome c-type biogenesis protein CcmH/NrfG